MEFIKPFVFLVWNVFLSTFIFGFGDEISVPTMLAFDYNSGVVLIIALASYGFGVVINYICGVFVYYYILKNSLRRVSRKRYEELSYYFNKYHYFISFLSPFIEFGNFIPFIYGMIRIEFNKVVMTLFLAKCLHYLFKYLI